MGGVLRLELDRTLSKSVVIGVLIFFLFGLVIVQVGIIKQNSQLKQHEEFIQLEKNKVERYINVKQFGWAGIRRALESTPLSAMFFNSTPLGSLVSFCDVCFRLELSKTEIGNGLFEDTHKGSLDYSWYILTIGGLFVSFWGFFAFRNKEYIRLLLDFTSLKNVLFGILLARIFLVFICQLIFLILYWIQFLINGISLTPRKFLSMLVFLLISTLVLFFLLVLSSALGSLKDLVLGGIITGVVFFILIWLWPEILNVIFSRVAADDIKSFYAHEIKKVEKLMKFEKEIYAKIGTGRYTIQQMIDIEKQAGEDWFSDEYGELEGREAEMISNTDNIIKQFQFVSIINPATFFKSVNGELSSKGFNAYRMFYTAILEGQKKFLRYYLDERWKENYKPKIEHILNDDELVLKSKPSLPHYFFTGIFVILFYILCALIYSFSRLKNFHFPAISGNTSKIDVNLKKGESILFRSDYEAVELLSNILHGYTDGFQGKFIVDGKDWNNKEKKDYHYFPNLMKFPGTLKISGKKLKDVSRIEGAMLLLMQSKKSIYFINLTDSKVYYNEIDEFSGVLNSLKEEGAVIICFCTSDVLVPIKFDHEVVLINVEGDFKFDIIE